MRNLYLAEIQTDVVNVPSSINFLLNYSYVSGFMLYFHLQENYFPICFLPIEHLYKKPCTLQKYNWYKIFIFIPYEKIYAG